MKPFLFGKTLRYYLGTLSMLSNIKNCIVNYLMDISLVISFTIISLCIYLLTLHSYISLSEEGSTAYESYHYTMIVHSFTFSHSLASVHIFLSQVYKHTLAQLCKTHFRLHLAYCLVTPAAYINVVLNNVLMVGLMTLKILG